MDRKDTRHNLLTAAVFAVVAPLGLLLFSALVIALGAILWAAGGNPLT